MKKAFVFLYSAFSITTASATVYDGSYSDNITITNDSIFEKNSIFRNSSVNLGTEVAINVKQGVSFIGAHIGASGNISAYTLNLTGNNIIFRDSKYGAIVAGLTDYIAYSAARASNISINISGENIIFDSNSVSGSYPSNRGGAIFIGLPNSVYYRYGIPQQILTITGTGAVFSNNSASTGGGAIYNSGATVDMQHAVKFTGNSAYYGGAIYNSVANIGRKVGAILKVGSGSEFISNSVVGTGGAIYNASYAYIGAKTVFSSNTASRGGAIYNTDQTGVLDIDTGSTGVYFETASDSIYNNGGTINFLGTGTIFAELTSLTSVQGCGTPIINLGRTSAVFDTVNLQDNTTLKTTVWRDGNTVRVGSLSANSFNIQNNDELKLQIAVDNRQVLSIDGAELSILIDRTDAQETGWDFFGNPDKHPKYTLENNLAYDIEFVRDGVYKIIPKAFINVDPSDESDVVPSAELAWNMTGFTTGSIAESVANEMHRLSQFADTRGEYENALELVVPDASGVVENVINRSTNANMRIINQRMLISKPGFWTTGGYSALSYNDYSGNVIGGTVGQDVTLSNSLNLGMAFGYSTASIDNDTRDFKVDSPFDMSLYAQLNIPTEQYDIYTNIIFNHSMYSITENKTVLGYGIDSEFDANQTSAQATLGFIRGWWGLDAGVRHNNLNLGSYTDSIDQHVAGTTLNTTYAIVGLNLGNNSGRIQWATNIGGEFVVAGDNTYNRIITAPNNQRYYHTMNISNDTAITFGAHMDVRITNAITLGLTYNGLIAGDYSEHTGKAHFNWIL